MVEEKIFTINLRKEFLKKPNYRRGKKSITAIREFITRHLKVEDVKIGKNLNLKIWERGRKNPPSKVKVNAFVEEKTAFVELDGFKFEKFKVQQKEEKKTMVDKLMSKKDEAPEESSEKEEKKEKEKELKKELKKEITKDHKPKAQAVQKPIQPANKRAVADSKKK